MDHEKLLQMRSESNQATTAPAPTTSAPGKSKPVVGAQISRGDLRLRATRLAQATRGNQPGMTAAGYPPERVDQFLALIVQFDATGNESMKVADKLATQAFYTKEDEALVFREKLVGIVRVASVQKPEVLAENPLKLSNTYSGPKLAKWFGEIQGLLGALREELARVSPIDWSAEVSAQEASLTEAVGVYELHVAQRQDRAEKRLAARNALAMGIEEVQAYAAFAFAGQPTVLKQFQKTTSSLRKTASKASGLAAAQGTSTPGTLSEGTTSTPPAQGAASTQSSLVAAPGPTPGPTENHGAAPVAAPMAPFAPVQPNPVVQQ